MSEFFENVLMTGYAVSNDAVCDECYCSAGCICIAEDCNCDSE